MNEASPLSLWEILVPTVRADGRPCKTRYHRVWDAQVREISKGLTIIHPSKGQWVSPEGALVAERVIPVRFMSTRAQAKDIAAFTCKYYEQECVMCYKISEEVIFYYAPKGK